MDSEKTGAYSLGGCVSGRVTGVGARGTLSARGGHVGVPFGNVRGRQTYVASASVPFGELRESFEGSSSADVSNGAEFKGVPFGNVHGSQSYCASGSVPFGDKLQ